MAFRATSTRSAASSATATGDRPTGVADDDILLALVQHSASSATIDTSPSGWVELHAGTSPGDFSLSIWWKKASSEPATWDWVWSASGAVRVDVTAHSGRDTTTPIHQSDADDLGGGTGQTISTSVVTTLAGTDLVAFTGADVGSSRTFTNDLTWTEETEDDDGNGMHAYIIRQEDQAAATYTPVVTVSGSVQHMGMFLIAIAESGAEPPAQPSLLLPNLAGPVHA